MANLTQSMSVLLITEVSLCLDRDQRCAHKQGMEFLLSDSLPLVNTVTDECFIKESPLQLLIKFGQKNIKESQENLKVQDSLGWGQITSNYGSQILWLP